jgi:dTDP-4-dehydrorhamnose reductase
LEHRITDPVSPGHRRRILITGAGGQLGDALVREFADAQVDARDRAGWDVCEPPPPDLGRPDLVLHAAAWTNVDRAESEPESAHRVNVLGTSHAASLGAPIVAYSTDYVFAGDADHPYVESDPVGPQTVYGRTKLEGEAAAGHSAWVVRTSWLFGSTGNNFVRTMLRLGAVQEEVAVVSDQRGCPTFVGHLAAATRELVEGGAAFGVWHLAADGECTWAEFAEAIFAAAGLSCRVRPITTAELSRPAPRPAYSVLRSERPGAPQLPHWHAGLDACLALIRQAEGG